MTYWHYSSFSFLNTFNDENSTVLGSFHRGAVDISQVATLPQLPTLFEFSLADVTV